MITHYSKQCTVVFDGYPEFSTKDTTHIRRTKGRGGRSIKLALNNSLAVEKEDFLLNKNNKQDFLFILGNILRDKGVEICHAPDDADTLVASTSLEKAGVSSVAVIADDTDILVLLLHHTEMSSCPIYFV